MGPIRSVATASGPRWGVGLLGWLLACAGAGCERVTGTFEIGGHVRLEQGQALEGVRVAVTWPEIPGQEKPLTTDPEGWYAWEWGAHLWGTGDGTDHVRVTPEDPVHAFDPPSYDVVLEGDRLDLDFAATPLEAGRPGASLHLWLVMGGAGPAPSDTEVTWHGTLGATPATIRTIDLRRRGGPPSGQGR